MSSQKLLIIGLDGADKQTLLKGINRNEFRNMSNIAHRGGISVLKSPLPPVTPVSMSSVLTGQSPGSHRVYGFEEDEGYVDYSSIQSRTLFDYLDEAGMDVIPVNVPMTSPLPENVDLGVSGFPVAEAEFARPYPVREKLREMDYSVEPSAFDDEEEERFVDEVFDLAEKRFRISQELIDEDWNVFFLMFTGDARLQHFIDDEDVIEDFYAEIDEYIGELRDRIGEDIEIMMVSDHGFSELEVRVDLGQWLAQEGYMEKAPESDTSKLYGEMKDRSEAKAYPAGAYMSGIFAGDEVKQEIVKKLEELEYDGRKVFRDVFLSEEIYGENNGPDIVPVPRRGFSHVAGYSGEVFMEESEEVKIPDREGVLISSLEIDEKAFSHDVLPTVLEYLEISYRRLDGSTLLQS